MQAWKCPIYNGTLENIIWPMWKITSFFWLGKVFIFFEFLHCFLRKSFSQRNRKRKHWYSIHILDQTTDKAFKGTVVNQGLSLLHEGNPWNYAYSPFKQQRRHQFSNWTWLTHKPLFLLKLLRNFMWNSIYRVGCLVNNGILNPFSDQVIKLIKLKNIYFFKLWLLFEYERI